MNDLTFIVYESIKPSFFSQGGYKYLIEELGVYCKMGNVAFRTTGGFEQFKKVYNLKKKSKDEFYENLNGKYKSYLLSGNFKIQSFWHIRDLPKNAIKFVALENGEYVYHYYSDIDGIRTIFKPNCNSHEVYKPLNYFKMSKLYG